MGKKKGKAPIGRAKRKQKAHNSSSLPHGAPPSQTSRRQQLLLDDDWADDQRVHFRGFAQTAAFAPPSRNSDAKLRCQAISFVSVGTTTPTTHLVSKGNPHLTPNRLGDDPLDDDDDEDEARGNSLNHASVVMGVPIASFNHAVVNPSLRASIEVSTDTVATGMTDVNITRLGPEHARMEGSIPEALPFVVDTRGDANISGVWAGRAQPPERRAPSPTPSSSSGEVVVFRGRNCKATVVNDPVMTSGSSAQRAVGWGALHSPFDTTQRDHSKWTPAPDLPYWRKSKGKAVPRPDLGLSAAEREAFAAAVPNEPKMDSSQTCAGVGIASDTISVLQADWKKTLRTKKKTKKSNGDLESLDDSKAPSSSRQRRRPRRRDRNRSVRKSVASVGEEGSEAAYEDYMENLRAQLQDDPEEDSEANVAALTTMCTSTSLSGPSLVVDGKEIGEQEVLPLHKKLSVSDDLEMNADSDWATDDGEPNPDFDKFSSEKSLDASDLEDELDYTEQQRWEDEADLRKRRIERMADEQYARLLAKQQELGIDTDELVIDDGGYMSASDDGFGDVQAARAGLSEMALSASGRRRNRQGMCRSADRRHHFPAASAMADTLDQYGDNGFDIMDYSRPSLRATNKGRRGRLPPELELLSDEELKESMAKQWFLDRDKKRQKKLERAELRAAGLLGSAGRRGIANLKAKYPAGMGLQHIHQELRAFLQDDELHERAFPPMERDSRKALHEIAVALGLSSNSRGSGKGRYPIIYKTSRTSPYSEEMFKRVLEASSCGVFSSYRRARTFAKGSTDMKKGKGGGVQAATVRHGEVIGAGAAEISHESVGHKLMLKMGWSKGMALGKDGEGLLVPVEQRMRVGTAGLG